MRIHDLNGYAYLKDKPGPLLIARLPFLQLFAPWKSPGNSPRAEDATVIATHAAPPTHVDRKHYTMKLSDHDLVCMMATSSESGGDEKWLREWKRYG